MMARLQRVIAQNEAVPEADRLENFPHPRETQELFGHRECEEEFARAFRTGRAHHAWLLTGPKGIGKATFAYKGARYLLARGHERNLLSTPLAIAPETTASRQVAALSHPDMLVLRRAYDVKTKRPTTTIPVDEVRRLRPFLGNTVEPGAWRVVIVDQANELNPSSANALLKALEEPPQRTSFFLIASEPGGLLATIRSRCRTLVLSPLGAEDLKRAAIQAMSHREDAARAGNEDVTALDGLIRVSGGRVRQLLTWREFGGDAMIKTLKALLCELPDMDWLKVHGLGENVSAAGAEQSFELFCDMFLERIAALVHAKVTRDGDSNEVALADRLINAGALASWAELWERVARERAETAVLNLDRKSLILNSFSRLAAVSAL